MIIFNTKPHLFISLLFTVFFPNGFLLPAVFFGALLPDIDTRNSVLGKFIPAWLFFKHRGFLHSFLGMALLLWIFSWGGNSALTYGIFIGYLSHLLSDAITPWGCPLFFPLQPLKPSKASKSSKS